MAGLVELVIDARSEDEVRARLPVTDGHKQPLGLVHGGVYAASARSTASA